MGNNQYLEEMAFLGYISRMIGATYQVKTAVFEGPLDLLLQLIEKRKLLINDIALSKVADDYIAYIKGLGQFPVGEAAHFVLIASTLLLIKSKSLLPTLELTEEERGDIRDLELRLKIYQRFKALATMIRPKLGATPLFLSEPRPTAPIFSPSADITLESLLGAIHNTLQNLPKKQFVPKAVVDKVISLEEMIGNLTQRISRNLKMSFKEFSGFGKAGKVNIIVGFLAMLELVKQGSIQVRQERQFDDIFMETNHVGLPTYN
ncbi:MAG: ScpA family protein [Candidatus Paceibacterota bacterium]|jgi:segregation and condensation protein A